MPITPYLNSSSISLPHPSCRDPSRLLVEKGRTDLETIMCILIQMTIMQDRSKQSCSDVLTMGEGGWKGWEGKKVASLKETTTRYSLPHCTTEFEVSF